MNARTLAELNERRRVLRQGLRPTPPMPDRYRSPGRTLGSSGGGQGGAPTLTTAGAPPAIAHPTNGVPR